MMAHEERARFYTFDPATREVTPFAGGVVAWAIAGGGLYEYRSDQVGRLIVATLFYGYDLRAAPLPEEAGDPPLLFETTIRHPTRGVLAQTRTATIAQAEAAHDAACLQAIARGPRAERWREASAAPRAAQEAEAAQVAEGLAAQARAAVTATLQAAKEAAPAALRITDTIGRSPYWPEDAQAPPRAAQEAPRAEGPAQEAAPPATTPEEAAEAARRARHVGELFAGLQAPAEATQEPAQEGGRVRVGPANLYRGLRPPVGFRRS